MKEDAPKKIKPFKIVLWCVLGVVLLLIFGILGTLLVEKYVKKASVPMCFGYGSLIVTTGSMQGTIDKGDLIIVQKTNDYKLGDIVTYVEAEGRTPITHRLINYCDPVTHEVTSEYTGMFIAKGDANNTQDIFPVSVDQIAGEVVATIPKLGLVFDWFVNDGGLIYAIALIAIIVACVYFWNRVNQPDEAEAGAADKSEHTDSPNNDSSKE